ncbi:MAG: DNA mismatch repair endonuclease MutL [Clostridia bacterium]|nr:DNA mismatch repair endonuclease MutL [Clostridia bacterium]
MKKINVLSQNVYNRIAAGEVVDRPYSAVKELIENSLDAGATEIEIYVERGGKQLIKVIDNGSGIEREDLHDAFMPHATSKISKASDLDYICTLGFRGEALASISAISKVEIISVTAGNQAWKINCDGGEISEIYPAALETGTVICVRDLFYNTPVRAKFLKADKKEEADITNFVTRYILGNPYVTFKYYVDGKLTLQSFGGGLDEAVAQVYGAKVLEECYKINAEKDGFRLQGYIGNQNFFKANKTYQSLFLNGRYIVNNTIATAVNNAYASYAMKRQFPLYVLNLDVPFDFVDVNVHPNKADVRFLDNRRVYGVVYSVISPILDGTAKAAEFVIEEKRLPEIKSTSDENTNKVYSENLRGETRSLLTAKSERKDEIKLEESKKPSMQFEPVRDLPMNDYMPRQEINVMRVTDDSAIPEAADFAYAAEKKKAEQQRIDFKECTYKGNLFDTYLICELDDKVYFIDQHAAHERLIYDGLIKKLNERNILKQPMLIPYIFNTNAAETQFIDSNLKVLRSIGFGIEPFGIGSYRIDEVPVDLQEIDINGFISEILSQIDSLKGISVVDIMKERLAMAACKHAIKGGMQLTEMEVDTLFEMIDGNTGLKCPHGRPICVTLTKKDIEKMFKRIV